ncbi:RIP metalloprotease RseP [Salinispira pacifica]
MIIQILIGLVGLGLVVFVHEAGHLIVAKLVGIEVEAFSIGWGKKLVGYTFRGTEYRISLIPLGGYCRMKGEHALQKAFETNADEIPKEPGDFYAARPWQRILVLLAGPAMNLLFAVVVLSIVWYAGFTIQTFGNRVVLESDYPTASSSGPFPATKAGLQTGDRILEIDGQKINDFRDIEQAVSPNPDTTLQFTVETPQGDRQRLSVTPALNKSTGAGRIGVYPWVDPVVGSVRGPAQQAGLKPGDKVVSLDGKPVNQSVQFQSIVDGLAGKTVPITYLRDGQKKSSSITIPLSAQDSKNRSVASDAGVRFRGLTVHTPRYTPLEAVGKGAQETVRTLTLTISGIGLLFRGVDLSQAVAGPIRITYLVGEVATQGFATSARAGLISFFNFLSLLSVVLFFMNLLPIPVLDGGQILLSAIEGVSRRPLRPRYVHRYQMVGVVIVFLLIFFAFFNDIMYFVRQ